MSVLQLAAEAASGAVPSQTRQLLGWLCPILGHFLGAIPIGLLLGYAVKGIDLRQHGSGNIGATNAARVLGFKWGLVAFLLDALKGLGPVLIARYVTAGMPASTHIQVVTGVFAILGHMFPIWLMFKGGKGVATGMGVALGLTPITSLIAFAVYVATAGLTRISSLGSLVACSVFPIVEWIRTGRGMFAADHWSLGVFSLAMPLLIIFRHRSNIVRLIRGQERPLADKPPV
jgi:glycerol-3-phosphate acyltransferase PlsY